MPWSLKSSLFFLSVLFLVSCGGSDDPAAPPGSGGQVLTPTITLGQAKALPLAAVAITGLPTGRDDLYGLVSVTSPGTGKAVSETVTQQAFVEHREDGSYFLTTPLHPLDPKSGGKVEIQVTNGSNVNSTPVTLEIEALPAADGAFAAMVGSLQALLDGWLPLHGTSREQLRSTDSAEFPDNWYPLFFAQDVIDNPDNPNSLRAIADGTAASISEGELDLDLLDRVIGLVGMQELLDGNQAFLDTMIAWKDTLDGGAPQGPVSGTAQGGFTISTAGELDYYMTMANNSKSRTEGRPGEILQAAGLGLGVLGVVTGGAPLVGAAGAGLWAYQTIEEAKAKLFPSTFDQSVTSCRFPQTVFVEDDAGPASWMDFRVAGRSDGMRIDKFVLESIMQFVGLAGKYGKWIDEIPQVAQDIGKFALGVEGGALINAASGAINLPARTWPTVDATLPGYHDSKINAGSAVSVSGQEYRPENVGQATVQVSTRSGRFGFQATLFHQVISVEAIKVTVSPEARNVEPGEPVDFTAEVENAMDETLTWTTTGGNLVVTSNYTATLQTPSDPWDVPIEVKARATTTAGIRGKPGAPKRTGRGIVSSRKGEVLIDPLFDCVKPDDNRTYSATILGFPPEDQEVQWLAQRGRFAGNVYTAPSTPGEDVITARSVVDPEVEGTAYVQVAGCVCWFNATLVGEVLDVYTGGLVIMDSNTAISVLTLAVTDDTSYPALNGQVVPGIPDGAIGQFPIIMSYSPSISTLYLGTDDEDLGIVSPILTLTVNSGGRIEGTISGEVHRFDSEGIAGTVSLNVNFQGETGFSNGGNSCDDGTR